MKWLDRIFYGKRFFLMDDSEKLIFLKRTTYRAMFTLLAVFGMFLFFAISYFNMIIPIQKIVALSENNLTLIAMDVEIDYEELTDKQIKHVDKVMKDLKPAYLIFQRKITFVKNIDKYCKADKFWMDCYGVNKNKGNLYIKYNTNDRELRETLCHELLHTIIINPLSKSRSNPIHGIVYSLGEQHVCFKKGIRWMDTIKV